MKILVVNDSDDFLQIAVAFMSQLSIDTICAKTLEEATKLDVRDEFDVIILGTILPDSCSPNVAMCFAKLCRASFVVLTGCPQWFTELYGDQLSVYVDKSAFAGSIQDVLEIIKTKLANRT